LTNNCPTLFGKNKTANKKMSEVQTPEGTPEGQTPEGTEGGQTPPIDYEAKFAASTRENQRIMAENQRLQADIEEARATQQQLEKDLKSYYESLREDNPQAFDLNQVKQSLNDIQKRIAVREEAEDLSAYLQGNPEAGEHREALKALGRSLPKSSYQEIWGKYFQPLIEKGEEAQAKNLQIKKQTQPETGKGAITEEPTGELSMAEFNKLTLEQQKAYLKKSGVKMDRDLQI
jgi:hypothetical protein